MKILDLHTHHGVPQPEGIAAIRFEGKETALDRNQLYSIGVHPWDSIRDLSETDWKLLEQMAMRPEIAAIGEAGVDLAGKGAALFKQLNLFKRQVELSERLGKPLVIHDVKAHDIMVGLRRDLKPAQNWAIHGFRGKPEVAAMLLRAGCYISFGEQFNRATLLSMPEDKILAETDDAPVDIERVISMISEVRDKDMTDVIAENTLKFLESAAEK